MQPPTSTVPTGAADVPTFEPPMSLSVPPTFSWLPVKWPPPEMQTFPRVRIGTETVTPPEIVVHTDVLSE